MGDEWPVEHLVSLTNKKGMKDQLSLVLGGNKGGV